jgi:glycine oxidase
VDDCLIIGAGVIGLAIGWDLVQKGAKVHLLDAGPVAQESSWAGAGIFPPAPGRPQNPYDKLLALSTQLFPAWCAELKNATQIDPEFETCGAIWLARSPAAAAVLHANQVEWDHKEITHRTFSTGELQVAEPSLRFEKLFGATLLPGETQARNPRLCQALATAITKHGSRISSGQPVTHLDIQNGRVQRVTAPSGTHSAKNFCIASGAWSESLGRMANVKLETKPIRGQIALLKQPTRTLRHIIYEAEKYLVPRQDGHVLVGSTVEDVGFDKSVTTAIAAMLEWARELAPELQNAEQVQSWAGLRPFSATGKPYLGRSPSAENLFVATGHYRAGIHLAPGTGAVMSQLIFGEQPQVDLAEFTPSS